MVSNKKFKKIGRKLARWNKETQDQYMDEGGKEWPPVDRLVKRWKSASGLECAIARGYVAYCAYVKVPKGHPLDGKYYTHVEGDIQVHGGLTFGCKAKEGGTWFGWDYGHAFDMWVFNNSDIFSQHNGRLWTLEEIIDETELTAKNLAKYPKKG